MMEKREREVYADTESAINRLRRNGIDVDTESRVVMITNRHPPGIKLWGAIDYLCHFARYGWGKAVR